MANHASSKKRVRRNARRAVVNKARVSRMRTFMKRVEQAIESGDQKAAETALQKAQPELYRNAARGIIHRNTVARKMSRLSTRIKAMK